MNRLISAGWAALLICTLNSWGAIGDDWGRTRGDASPGLRYDLATVTSSGRILGVSHHGSMMYSDDGGTSWKFDRIEIDGGRISGVINTLYQVPGGNLVAVMNRLEEGGQGFFNYNTSTYFLISNDNGNTWTQEPFPKTYALFAGSGRKYYGVDIRGLQMGPGGQLLAYGTTSGTNYPGFVLWSIGGVIFRQTGNDWVQAHFGYGPVGKLTSAGGRAVAVSHNAILDSADGAGWNGYVIGGAQINLNGGGLMDNDTRVRLRAIDVEVLGGTYIAQTATFVPYGDSGLIDTNIFDQSFLMTSSSPFSGSRNWAASTSPYHGLFNKTGDKIVTTGAGASYYTSSGNGFTLANEEMRLSYTAIAIGGGGTAYGMETSEKVWKTTNGGASWTKIRDEDVGPNLQLLGAVDGILYARAEGNLWTSYDLGDTWQETSTEFKGFRTIVDGGNGRLFSPASSRGIQVSEDRGKTWTTQSIPTSENALMMLKSRTGRLIVPLEGKSVQNEGVFFVSDDDGASWTSRVAGLQWNEEPRAIVQTQSGRIIVATNTFASFEPELYYSDDDGETWSVNTVLKTLDGLDPITNEPQSRVIEIKDFHLSSTGRILALGDEEILTSDDDGVNWTVRANLNLTNSGSWLNYDIRDITQAGSRWIAVGSYRTPYPQSLNKLFFLVSDDDGATWGQRPYEARQSNTYLSDIMTDPESGRVIITGSNGTVLISEPDPVVPSGGGIGEDGPAKLSVREGKIEYIPVERPDVDGAVEAAYVLRQDTALINTDFKPGGGILSWAADDQSQKLVPIETIDNSQIDGDRQLTLQLVFETSDDFLGTIEIPVSIVDNDTSGPAGLIFNNPARTLYTTESGGFVDLEFALQSKPSANVVITIGGVDSSEGTLSGTTFTFTPTNWNQLQTLTVTGVDDNFPDGASTYELTFAFATEDAQYSVLPATRMAITNLGDEAYEVGGELFDKLLEGIPIKGFMLDGQFAFSFKVPVSDYTFVFGSEISSNFTDWSPGPAPVAGATENGLTTYTLVLSPSSTATFARIKYDVVPK